MGDDVQNQCVAPQRRRADESNPFEPQFRGGALLIHAQQVPCGERFPESAIPQGRTDRTLSALLLGHAPTAAIEAHTRSLAARPYPTCCLIVPAGASRLQVAGRN